MTESINCDLARQDQRWMNTRRVREELVLRIQNGGLTTQQDTEKGRESFLIWLIFARNFNLQRGKSFNSSFNFMFFHDPRRSESIRVDPTRTGGPSWSGPTFVPACWKYVCTYDGPGLSGWQTYFHTVSRNHTSKLLNVVGLTYIKIKSSPG